MSKPHIRRLVILLCLAALLNTAVRVRQTVATNAVESRRPILIDPGHGGADGGTVGVDGTEEKAVNLAISTATAAFLGVMGCPVQLTRTSDNSIHSADVTSLREQKISDMHNRLALYEQAALVVSIHQNCFSESRYSGAQMFYAPQNPQSRPLADSLRNAVLSLLQPDNTRALKAADTNLYLLSNTTVPTALVECGFLSNPAECAALATPLYQQKMACAVTAGILNFYVNMS